ncbi:MAG: hypothetical protein IKP22_15375 [Clostridia bacterium]|nr:hypothetical protein [Clostridia bacterium]
MKKIAALCVFMFFLAALDPGGARGEGMVIENGEAMPFVRYSDPWDEDYSNENSQILRFAVWVETDHDTDLDGKPDLVKAMVQLPRAAAEGKYHAPVVFEARPYIAGMYVYNPDLPVPGASATDGDSLLDCPQKRVPQGEADALEAALQANCSDWNYRLESDPFGQRYLGNLTAYDQLLVRGFAVVQSAGLGTFGSEGLLMCGSRQETAAFRCVIEWLTGRRNAFTGPDGRTVIPADWCSGDVGMIGRSYAGALACSVASTGVEGLRTVVSVAGPASWYEYGNSQGAPNGLLSTWDFAADLSIMCASRFFDGGDEKTRTLYENCLAFLRDRQIALEGDYGPFWAEREPAAGADFRASALIVQGMRDETVRPKQLDLMRRAFLRCGCEVKCILHMNGHVTPANEQTKTDIMIGDRTFTEWLCLWFTHTLLGEDNEAAQLPDFLVQSNVDGRFYSTDQWMTGNTLLLSPGDGEEHTVSAKGAHMSNYSLSDTSFDGASGPDRLLWAMDVTEEITINGSAEVRVRVKTGDTDKNILMMGAVLVDRADNPFPCFDTGAVGVLDQDVILEGGVDRGEGAERYDLVSWRQRESEKVIVSYGSMDLRNPEAGYEPSSAVRREEDILPDTWYDCTVYLQPVFYTVPAGHRLEMYIVPFCAFSDDSALYDQNTPDSLEEMGLDPLALVPVTRDYAFTVDNSLSRCRIPVFR